MPEKQTHLISQCRQSVINMVPSFSCNFRCEAGFELQGAHSIQCTQGGRWSEAIPACKGIKSYFDTLHIYIHLCLFALWPDISSSFSLLALECPAPEIPTSIQISCSSSPSPPGSPHLLGTICSFSCAEGFELQGTFSMKCVNPGRWTAVPPTCTGSAPISDTLFCSIYLACIHKGLEAVLHHQKWDPVTTLMANFKILAVCSRSCEMPIARGSWKWSY